MFEEIKQRNSLVRDQIYKGFVGGEELLEKAHQEGDIHPNGKWVWTKLPSGKYDWRVRKDGTAKKPKQMTIDDIPDADFKRITKFLQTKDPESSNDQRHLEPEGMTDKELDMFRTVAEYFRFNNGQLSDRVRKNVGKWANLALEEQASRRKEKKETNDAQEAASSKGIKAWKDLTKKEKDAAYTTTHDLLKEKLKNTNNESLSWRQGGYEIVQKLSKVYGEKRALKLVSDSASAFQDASQGFIFNTYIKLRVQGYSDENANKITRNTYKYITGRDWIDG